MMAAWQVRPPRLVTMADARFMTGSQSGSVMSVTSTSPGWTRFISLHFADHPRRAGADAMADAAAGDEHLASVLQVEALQRSAAAALHRLGSGLQDVQLAVFAVLAPFDVHRTAVVFFDDQRLARQFLHVGVVEAEAVPVLRCHVDWSCVASPSSP